MNLTQNPARKHAIVIGGSIMGLLAARVLSEFYREVTLIERDSFPSEPVQRRGVPQGRHAHGLLAGGCSAVEELFPGFSKALVDRGAVSGDVARDCRWFFAGNCLARPAKGMNGLLLTRPMFEAAVRERVLALTNVRRRDNVAVSSLLLNERADRVIGVLLGDERLTGDLIVDATGRGSHTPQWLQEMDYEKPREETVQVALGYTTRFFKRRPDDLHGDVAAVIPSTPEGKRGGVILAQENDQWTVTLFAHFGNYAPEDLEGFIEFAKTLEAPFIHEVIRDAEPIGEAATIRFPASVRRRYEDLSNFPAGFLVLGDAACSFNPVYGQGMSVAALEAMELRKVLAGKSSNLARDFFTRAAKVVDIPWSIAVGNDLRMPQTVGARTLAGNFINWYISKLHKAAHRDPILTLAFLKVSNLLTPPAALLHPRIALRVFLSSLAGFSGEKARHAELKTHQKGTVS